VEVKTYPFTEYFKGFENLEIVKRIFGNKTVEAIRNLKVEFSSHRGYMGVSDLNGHLIISAHY
jgi:hypothetical protein